MEDKIIFNTYSQILYLKEFIIQYLFITLEGAAYKVIILTKYSQAIYICHIHIPVYWPEKQLFCLKYEPSWIQSKKEH
jgi:hypothetical protein